MTILFCLYNHSQQLEGRADGTITYVRNPIQEEGNYYKREWREAEEAGTPPNTPEAPEKALWTEPRTNPLW